MTLATATNLFAASAQRTISWIIVVTIVAAMVLYWLFNWLQNKDEIGSEIELAPNRKPQWGDDLLETKRLDWNLFAGVGLLAILGITLPLYWITEPGRHDGAIEFYEGQNVKAGQELFDLNCAQCHGSAEGGGGVASFAIVDDNGNFVEQVDWKAPSLAGVLYRFSEEEVRYILTYGRSNSPMPAWGAAGGGPMTAQQIDHIIEYLGAAQISGDEIADRVEGGLEGAAFKKVLDDDADLRGRYYAAKYAAEHPEDGDAEALGAAYDAVAEEVDAAAMALVAQAEDDQVLYGELIFSNTADNGAYGCARCHTAGWSYDADSFVYTAEAGGPATLLNKEISAGGGFGPNLTNGATLRQFDDNAEQEGFVILGSVNGQRYGNFGQGDGGGQMPAFGTCVGDRDTAEGKPLKGLCEHLQEMTTSAQAATLSPEQIAAVVAYERSLTGDDGAAAAPEEPADDEAEEEPAEEEPAAVDVAIVDATVTIDNLENTIVLDGEVLTDAQHEAIVAAVEADFPDYEITDNIEVLDAQESIPNSDARVDGLGLLLPQITPGMLNVSANLRGESVTVTGVADSPESKAAADAATATFPGVETNSTITVDEAGEIRTFDLTGVEFETGTANLTAAAQGILDEAALALEASPDVDVEVQGHTDDRGSDESNQRLSQARAEAVVEYLVGQGVDADRLEPVGYGETDPIADNDTAEGQARNRRVQFEVK